MKSLLISLLLLLSLGLVAKEKIVYVELVTGQNVVYQFNYYEGKKLLIRNEFIDTLVSNTIVRTLSKKTIYFYEKKRIISTKNFYYYPTIKISQRGIYITNQIKETITKYEYK